eukprot:TRINITY_DN14841_c0_g1_i1.p1 TRINITY_DN14841_c0_g1~~TRINITY_DN14841_c0_g1_i1.p1  ORF type:complete len:279 (+),score=81.77 TRINITY_DN14841_c0_g1_i1:24-860(+)
MSETTAEAARQSQKLSEWNLKSDDGDMQQAALWAENAARLWHQIADKQAEANSLLAASAAYSHRIARRQGTAPPSLLQEFGASGRFAAERAYKTSGGHAKASSAALLPNQQQADSLLHRCLAQVAEAIALADGDMHFEKLEKALNDSQEARLIYNDLSNRRGVAAALLAEGQVRIRRGERIDARVALEKAQDLFQRASDEQGRCASVELLRQLSDFFDDDDDDDDEAEENLEDVEADGQFSSLVSPAGLGDLGKAWNETVHVRFTGLRARPVTNVQSV